MLLPFDQYVGDFCECEISDCTYIAEACLKHDGTLYSCNFRDLNPGDIVLFAGGASIVEATQKLMGFDGDDTQWTHVAIYAGDGRLWEANPGSGVKGLALAEALKRQKPMRVVRHNRASPKQGAIQRGITTHMDAEYPLFLNDNWERLLRTYFGITKTTKTMRSDHIICSEFAKRVLETALNFEIVAEKPVVLPADYASSSEFSKIDVLWARYK